MEIVCFSAFSWGCVYAPNVTSLLIFRFLAGVFGSSSLNNTPATIADASVTAYVSSSTYYRVRSRHLSNAVECQPFTPSVPLVVQVQVAYTVHECAKHLNLLARSASWRFRCLSNIRQMELVCQCRVRQCLRHLAVSRLPGNTCVSYFAISQKVTFSDTLTRKSHATGTIREDP